MNYQIISPSTKQFFYSDFVPWTTETGRVINKRECFVSIQRLYELGYKCFQQETLKKWGFIPDIQ